MESVHVTDRDRLAIEVAKLARTLVLADNRFLSAALGRMELTLAELQEPLATDGRMLYVCPQRMCSAFAESGELPKHDFLHAVLHCLFLHPFVGETVDINLWGLACDVAVERVVAQVCGRRSGERGAQIERALDLVGAELGGHAGAERIYRSFLEGSFAGELESWRALFTSDDHAVWEDVLARNAVASAAAQLGGSVGDASDCLVAADDEISSDDMWDADGTDDWSDVAESCGVTDQDGKNRADDTADASNGEMPRRAGDMRAQRDDASELEASWRRVAKSLAVEMRSHGQGRSEEFAGLIDELESASRKRVDYAEFLRQFSAPTETLKVSDEEFDYVLYTYGLERYGNLPLIEPLEYRDQKRVREFVVAIDTSRSVWGDAVKRFARATFDILKSTESFSHDVHLRIMQCDTAVRAEDVIRSELEFDAWIARVKLHGGGGTDFRPVFDRIDELVEDGEFQDLGGLVYFTDGQGTYPDWVPTYKTAFVFYGDDCRPDDAPPWAARVLLDDLSLPGGVGL